MITLHVIYFGQKALLSCESVMDMQNSHIAPHSLTETKPCHTCHSLFFHSSIPLFYFSSKLIFHVEIKIGVCHM